MRLFVALPLSEGFRNEVAAYCRRLAPYFDSARPSWVPVENLHFTLHFFGEVDTGSLQELTAHIDDCSQIAPPLDLKTGGLSFLPSVRAPRILYLDAVIEPMAPLLTLVDALRSLAADMNAEIDSRPWKAHLTLARLKAPQVPRISELPSPPRLFAHIETFALMASKLERSGAQYTLLKEFPLEGCTRQ